MQGGTRSLGELDEDFIARLGEADAVSKAIGRAISQCRATCPCREDPCRGVDAVPAPPFGGRHINQRLLVIIVEHMSAEGLTLFEAAAIFDVPAEQLKRRLLSLRHAVVEHNLRQAMPQRCVG